MSLEIRQCDDSLRDALHTVHSQVYREGQPVGPDEDLIHSIGSAYVALRSGVPVGSFRVLENEIWRAPTWLPNAGIAAVAVVPHERSTGVGGAMMRFALQDLRRRGFVFATLYAFREPYYRQFGYESVGRRMNITVPNGRHFVIKPPLSGRLAGASDWTEFDRLYRAFTQGYSGGMSRSEARWRRILEKKDPCRLAYLLGDPAEAYVLVFPRGSFWIDQEIDELVWTSPAGYRSALALMLSMLGNKSTVQWEEPINGPFRTEFRDRDVKFDLPNPAMVRVLDVSRALLSLRPTGWGECVVQVQDREIVENEGPWLVSWFEGKVRVAPTDLAPQVTFDPGAFSQAFFGDPSLAELVAAGRVTVSGDFSALHHLLPAQVGFAQEFF